MSHDPFALDDAAYVLGALSPSDRQAYEEHLRSCERCAATVAELAGLPGLLARADRDALDDSAVEAPVPPDLLTGLRHQVRRDRRRRRVGTLTAAAVVVAVVATTSSILTWGIVRQLEGSVPAPAERTHATAPPFRQMTQVAQHELSASVGIESAPWGTRLTVVCDYAVAATGGGYGEGGPARYELVVLTDGGREEAVASWVALPGRAITVTGATSWSSDEIVDVEVRGANGRPVLRLAG